MLNYTTPYDENYRIWFYKCLKPKKKNAKINLIYELDESTFLRCHSSSN